MMALALAAAICGIFCGYVFRRFSSSGTRAVVNRMMAHVLEFRLFLDEPAVIWKAQRDLLRANLRLLRCLALPVAIAAPVFALVVWLGGARFGRGPLPAGQAAVVTARMTNSNVRLLAPPSIIVETPGVRIPRLHEVSWRIRPSAPFEGRLATTEGAPVAIPFPSAKILGVSWVIWFLGISALAGMAQAWRPALLMTLVLLAAPARAADRPPVILISIDTLRADHLAAYGYQKTHTPFIDELAAGGTVFEHIDTQIPLTLPSHTVLFTSTYPFANGVEANAERVPAGAVTLASVLRANGYRTGAFIGSIILDRRYGLDQGFDEYDSPFQTAPGQLPNPYSARVRRDAALVTRAARQWILENRGAPFFAFLHFYDVHTPYTLPQAASLMPNTAGYDAEVEHVDQALARLQESLAREGLWDKSLVVLVADHGESLGDHGETSHGYFIYESTMHVPLIVHWPAGGERHPPHMSEAGGLIDVAPTILDLLHLAKPASFAGASLLGAARERPVYGESVYARDTFGWAALRSLQSGAFKYIDAPKAELYDLAKDPGERVNLFATHASDARALKSRLDTLVASPAATPNAPQISAHTREVLGSLGYTAGGRASTTAHPADPKDKLAESEAYENGLAQLYTGQYEKALATLRRIVAQDPRNLPALTAMGEAHLRAGNVTAAIEAWQKVLERDPHYHPAADSIAAACRMMPSAPPCRGRRP